MSKLLQSQFLFSIHVQKLIQWAVVRGYMFTYGEVYRTKEQQFIYYKAGLTKTLDSLHMQRLAVDFNIFKNGKLLESRKEIQPLGEYWKALSDYNIWGGDFNNNGDTEDDNFHDPNHFQTNIH